MHYEQKLLLACCAAIAEEIQRKGVFCDEHLYHSSALLIRGTFSRSNPLDIDVFAVYTNIMQRKPTAATE